VNGDTTGKFSLEAEDMRDDRRDFRGQDPVRRFDLIGKKLERWLIRSGIVLAVLLILFQCMLRFPTVRSSLIRVDTLEGVRYLDGTGGFEK
jgi:hypothetical protein